MLEYIKQGAIVGLALVLVNKISEKFLKKTWI